MLRESGRSDAAGGGLTFPLYNDRFPNELLECLRLLVLRTSDVERVSDGRRVPITELRLQTPINNENEVGRSVRLTYPAPLFPLSLQSVCQSETKQTHSRTRELHFHPFVNAFVNELYALYVRIGASCWCTTRSSKRAP